jgi:hypothetical protein
MVIKDGAEKVDELKNKYSALNQITPDSVKNAQKLQEQLGEVSASLVGVEVAIMDKLYPALMKLAPEVQNGITEFVKWNEESDGLGTEIIATSAAFITLSAAIQSLNALGVPVIFRFLAAHPLITGALAAFYSKGLNQGEDKELLEAQKAAGLTNETDIPRNLRNNNPGNIEYGNFAKSQGATSSDGRFAVFPDMETGKQAQIALLKKYVGEGTNTISKMVRKWSPVSAENPESVVSAYENAWAKKEGIDKNKVLTTADITEHFRASQESQEGVATGKLSNKNVSVKIPAPAKQSSDKEKTLTESLHSFLISKNWKTAKEIEEDRENARNFMGNLKNTIDPKGFFHSNPMIGSSATAPTNTNTSNKTSIQNNNVTVNTQATDAKGIARELPKALDDNAARMLGMGGSN